ncbi:MAG: hypothetical protein Q8J60_09355 [Thiobacillus sp.]|nr:hypothetical protein [Thiobacillus sp.]
MLAIDPSLSGLRPPLLPEQEDKRSFWVWCQLCYRRPDELRAVRRFRNRPKIIHLACSTGFESGGLRETDELYRNFRGSDPGIEPLLRNRGFGEPSPAEG